MSQALADELEKLLESEVTYFSDGEPDESTFALDCASFILRNSKQLLATLRSSSAPGWQDIEGAPKDAGPGERFVGVDPASRNGDKDWVTIIESGRVIDSFEERRKGERRKIGLQFRISERRIQPKPSTAGGGE